MALVLKDRVKETTTTTGTGTITLAGASTGYQSFSVIGNANTTYYCIAGQGTAEWEVGIGTYTASGTTLSRDTILASSNSGSVVTFSAGTKDVFVVYPAGKSVNLDASGNATALGTPASCTVTNFTGTASININGTVGATTPSTGAFTTLSSTGNTTLGDASTDTVTVNGYMGVGGGGVVGNGLQVVSSALSGVNQTGVYSALVGTSGGTNRVRAFLSFPASAAASYTVNDMSGFWAADVSKGAGSTITNLHGLYIADQTQGTNNYGITSLVSSGASKWNIYASGTANNVFAGNVRIGSVVAPTVALDVTGAISASGNATVGSATAMSAGGQLVVSADAGSVPLGGNYYNIIAKRSGTAGFGSGIALVASNTGFNRVGFGDTDSIEVGFIEYDHTSNFMRFAVSGSERLRIDSSGNVGIGVTPSAWQSTHKAIDVNTRGGFSSEGTATQLTLNAYYNAGWKYKATDEAALYEQFNGTHAWYIAPSGTAGNAITFTQAMTLDASGRLLIGSTSSNSAFGGNLQVEGTSGAFCSFVRYSTSAAGAPGLYLARSKGATVGTNTIVASGDTLGNLLFSGANGTGYSDAASISAFVDGTPGASADMPGRLVFSTSSDGSATPTERMRINSSGNVGIGTSSPSVKLEVNRGSAGSIATFTDGVSTNFNFSTSGTVGTFGTDAGSTSLALKTSGAERMRIDSSGNVGIGTSSPNDKLTVASDNYLSFQTSSTTFNSGRVARIGGVSVGSGNGYLSFETYQGGSGGGERARIDSSGNVGIGTSSPGAKLDVVGASGVITRAAATQDGVELVGRAGGTSSYKVTFTPTTLTASRTLTLPNNTGTVLTTGATVTVAQGGTGATTLTANNVLLGNGTSAVQVVAPGSNGNVLRSNGTTWTSSALTLNYVPTDVSNGVGSFNVGTDQTNPISNLGTTASFRGAILRGGTANFSSAAMSGTWRNVSGNTIDGTNSEYGVFQRIS